MLLIENLDKLVTFTTSDRTTLKELTNVSVLCNTLTGCIESIKSGELSQKSGVKKVIDGRGLIAIPGFVDAHTHPVWAGDRINEWKAKLEGKSYLEIHKAGGGIHYTVRKTAEAMEEDLYKSLMKRLRLASSSGTTTIEAKTGYGLTWEEEYKQLRVINKAVVNAEFIDISVTYCGAHAIPPGLDERTATVNILTEHIPKISDLKSQGVKIDNIDVFCEQNVFGIESSRQIIQAGEKIGLKANFHAEELHPLGGAKLVDSLQRKAAVSHLEMVDDEGIELMRKNNSVAVILPTTAYILKLPHPPVRKLIESGIKIALGTDFNPNVFCTSMPLVMHLACTMFNLTLEEALAAATVNSAEALDLDHSHGTLEAGKRADLLLLKSERWENIIYEMANHTKQIAFVIKKGQVVLSNNLSGTIL